MTPAAIGSEARELANSCCMSAMKSCPWPTSATVMPDFLANSAALGWVATRTSCPAARNAHISGTIGK